jgi:hypothetical protein
MNHQIVRVQIYVKRILSERLVEDTYLDSNAQSVRVLSSSLISKKIYPIPSHALQQILEEKAREKFGHRLRVEKRLYYGE